MVSTTQSASQSPHKSSPKKARASYSKFVPCAACKLGRANKRCNRTAPMCLVCCRLLSTQEGHCTCLEHAKPEIKEQVKNTLRTMGRLPRHKYKPVTLDGVSKKTKK